MTIIHFTLDDQQEISIQKQLQQHSKYKIEFDNLHNWLPEFAEEELQENGFFTCKVQTSAGINRDVDIYAHEVNVTLIDLDYIEDDDAENMYIHPDTVKEILINAGANSDYDAIDYVNKYFIQDS